MSNSSELLFNLELPKSMLHHIVSIFLPLGVGEIQHSVVSEYLQVFLQATDTRSASFGAREQVVTTMSGQLPGSDRKTHLDFRNAKYEKMSISESRKHVFSFYIIAKKKA